MKQMTLCKFQWFSWLFFILCTLFLDGVLNKRIDSKTISMMPLLCCYCFCEEVFEYNRRQAHRAQTRTPSITMMMLRDIQNKCKKKKHNQVKRKNALNWRSLVLVLPLQFNCFEVFSNSWFHRVDVYPWCTLPVFFSAVLSFYLWFNFHL